MGKKLTKEEFINRSILKHGDKYDYSLVNYINLRAKIIIVCKKHGIFQQKSDGHLNGVGCPKCYGNKKLDNDVFIEKALLLHGNRYDYSLVNYINYDTKINIICMKHGMFEQTPNNHLAPSGCPKCFISKGENLIVNFLDKNNIRYSIQHTFNNCVGNKNKLRFDFYLPDNGICIEFDGKQHFEPVRFNGCSQEEALRKFNNCKLSDEIKTNYCLDNNIKLIRIPFNMVDIEKYLIKEIK